MTTNIPLSNVLHGLHGALLSGEIGVIEDRSLIFIVDRLARTCPACGTVFEGSASQMAVAGPETCPFCGRGGSRPLVRPGNA